MITKKFVCFCFLKEPKGCFILNSACKVSEIRSDISRKRKQFLFRITWPPEEDLEEAEGAVEGGVGGAAIVSDPQVCIGVC